MTVLFRSLVIGMNIALQSAVRDEHGRVENPVLWILETTSADGLRVQVIAYMCDHLEDYQSFPIEAINGDMPLPL